MKKIFFSGLLSLIVLSMSAGVQAAERYIPQGDGSEILDTKTQLVWQRCAVGMVWSGGACMGTALGLSIQESFISANTLAVSSGQAWRVPNIRELLSIVDYDNPPVDVVAFPNTPSSSFWTSTRGASYSWGVFFTSSYSYSFPSHLDGHYLRLVRFP